MSAPLEYDFMGAKHYMSHAEYTSVRMTGDCSHVEYHQTPSIPHRAQLIETRMDMVLRPDRVKPRSRPTEEDRLLTVKYWLKAHVAQWDGNASICGHKPLNLLSEADWRKVRSARPDRVCGNCESVIDRSR